MKTGRLSPTVRLTAVYAYAAMTLLGAVLTIVNSTQSRLAESYGVAVNRISLLISCMGVGRLLIQAVCGALSDRLGRKNLSLIGFLGMLVYFGVMPMVTSLLGGMLMCVFCGVAYGMVNTTMLALVFDCYAGTGRSQAAQVRVQTVYALGGILVPLGAGALLDGGMPWTYLYWMWGAATLLMILLHRFIHFPPTAARAAAENGYVRMPSLKKEGALLLVGTFCLYGAHTMGLTWMTTLAAGNTAMGHAEAVRVLSIFSLGALLGSLAMIRLVGRFTNLQLLTWSPLLAACFFALCILTHHPWVFRGGALLAGMCTGSLFNLLVGEGGYMFPRISGTISGLMSTASGAASLVVPALTGWMLDGLTIQTMFCVVFLLLLTGVIAIAALRRRDRLLRA